MIGKTRILAATFVLLIAQRGLNAAVLYDSGGFESPRFTNAVLQGQDPVFGPWLRDNTLSTATIQSSVVQAGTQAVRVDRAADPNGDERWAVSKPIIPSTRYVTVSWDENVTKTVLPGVAFGPLFGVEAYDDNGTATPSLIGSSFIDSSTGDVLFQQHTTGVLIETGVKTAFGQWNHFALQADYNTSTYQLLMNGIQIASNGFVDSGIIGFSDAPLATVAFTDTAANAAASGTAYFDNYAINTTNTPEPTMVGFLGLAVLGLGSRRRRPR